MNEIQNGRADLLESEEDLVSPTQETTNISRIRDIIVGNEIREFARRFRIIERTLDGFRRYMDERYNALEERLSQQLELMRNEMRQNFQEIDRKTSERNDELTSRYQADIRKLSDTIEAVQCEMSEHMNRAVMEQNSRIAELREQLRRNYEQLSNQFTEECDSLDAAKVNRYDLGDSLIALGMRFKDDTILEELSVQLLEEDEN